MSAPPLVDPPTRPFQKPRHSRAAPEIVGADAVTETTVLWTLAVDGREVDDDAVTTMVRAPARTGARPPAHRPSPVPRVRRLPGPSETGRFPSPKPRIEQGEPDTVTVAASALAATRAPVSPAPEPAPRPSTGPRPAITAAAAAPAPAATPDPAPASPPVLRTATPARPGTLDSAAALERAGLAGLHPLTREQPVRRRGMRRIVAQVPAPYSLVGDGEDVPALLTRMYAMVVRDHWGGGDGDTTHVVQLTPWYACDLGFELVSAGRILGHAPVHGDITPDLPVDPPEPDDPAAAPPGAPTPTVLSLRHPSVDDAARSALADAGRIVVVADTARSDHRTIQDSVTALRELGAVVAGLVVYRGRIPRDPAYGR